jgi:hypothetical protein
MVSILDKLLDFCSSLKLAICLILSLAFYLAAATCYEARYGTRAVQDMIYSSRPFILLMAMLSINVMAAVLVRYPWKRKQTGFIITHCGIETLLLGCLLSFRYSVDGRVSLEPGQKSEVINLNDEEVGITMADAGGKERRHVYPVNLWHDAGYPGLAKFVLGSLGAIDLPPEATWTEGHTVDWSLGGGAKIQVLEWLPAAVGETVVKPSPDGFPAAIVDQDIPLVADGQGGGMVRPFGGTIELDLWKARSDDEVAEFVHPPAMSDLPEQGRIDVYLDGKQYSVDVTPQTMGKAQTLGTSGYAGMVNDYILHAPPPQLPENHGQDAIASEPVDPQVSFTLIGPGSMQKYLLAAWHPQFMAHLDDADMSHHGSASATDPLIWYWHPQTYFTTKEGTRGRLMLLQTPDGRLLARMFGMQTQAGQQPGQPFEITVGKELTNFWLNISLTVTQHCPSGVLSNEFRQAHVEPNQMDDHSRAIKVALDVDGSHQETWLERGDNPVELNTPRGPVQLDYGFREYELGFAVGLDHAEQTNDPGSNQAAAYTSGVTLVGSTKDDGPHTITMNEPLTVQGLTFYQAGLSQDQGFTFSTLSVRHDPGWVIKYIGCALIVGGIFTMFYMKAYFQKSSPIAVPENTRVKQGGKAVVATGSRGSARAVKTG